MLRSRLGFWSGLVLLSLLLGACGGLAGEPQIVATVPPRPTALPERGFPLNAPDMAVGARIFAERCARCHGVTGSGDGEFVATGQLPAPPPDMSDPQTARAYTPKDWFDVITNGRMDKLMPPWGGSLSEAERWAVGFYTYTLHASQAQLENGRAVWEASCAGCHGAGGQGDGPRAGEFETLPDLTDPSRMVGLSDEALLASLSAPPHDLPELAEAQRQAAILYLRALLLTSDEVIGRPLQVAQAPAETQEPQASPAATAAATALSGSVSGIVANGSPGAEVPADLVVTLRVLDTAFNAETFETTVDASGAFRFDDVNIRADRGYVATVFYQDRIFASEFVTGDPAAPNLNLPITIYEVTSDPSVIVVVGMVAQVVTDGSQLQIAYVVSFTNTSRMMFSGEQLSPNGPYASVRVPVPPGAQVIDMGNTGQRLVLSEDGTAMIDTSGVLPGAEHIVHILFSLPHDGSTPLETRFDYAFEGPMRILLGPETLSVTSDQLPSIGPQTVGSQVYQGWGSQLSLPAGEPIRFTINGDLRGAGTAVPPVAAPDTALAADRLLPLVFIGFGLLALIGAGLLYWRGRRMAAVPKVSQATPPAERENLMDGLVRQLAELDDAYEAGEIDQQVYEKRRARLKTRLAELLDNEGR